MGTSLLLAGLACLVLLMAIALRRFDEPRWHVMFVFVTGLILGWIAFVNAQQYHGGTCGERHGSFCGHAATVVCEDD